MVPRDFISYLCTYDLYGPVPNAGSIHYEGKWEGVGPWKSRLFWALQVPFQGQSPPTCPSNGCCPHQKHYALGFINHICIGGFMYKSPLVVSGPIHRKKRFPSFPQSPAGISLTKLPNGRNNSVMTSLFPPMESLVVTSRLGTGNSGTFFLRCTTPPVRLSNITALVRLSIITTLLPPTFPPIQNLLEIKRKL
jgi:hypothetical protein